MPHRTACETLDTSLGAGALATNISPSLIAAVAAVGGRRKFHHSLCRWCFGSVPLEQLATTVKPIGIESIELLEPGEWSTVQEHGLTCALGSLIWPDGVGSITKAFNRKEHHDILEKLYIEGIDLAAKAGIKQLICFSGNRDGIDNETGMENCAEGLKRILARAEKQDVTIVMELLNSKVDHHDYMCDHTAWGAALADSIASSHFKLLYDIYHMQIMEGDVIATIRKYHDRISHYHTAGVPGRNEIDDSQELNYQAICSAIADTGFDGYLAQEFTPRQADPFASLRDAIQRCSV